MSKFIFISSLVFLFSCAVPRQWTADELRQASQIEVFSVNTEPKQNYEKLGKITQEMGVEVPLWAQILSVPTLGLASILTSTHPNSPELLQRLQLQASQLGGNGIINFTITILDLNSKGYASGDVVRFR